MNITVYMKKTLRPIEQRSHTGWFIGILILAYDNPCNDWVIFHPIYTANDFRGEMVTAKKIGVWRSIFHGLRLLVKRVKA